MLVNFDRVRRWPLALAHWILVNFDRARPWLLGAGRRARPYGEAARRGLGAGVAWATIRTRRPRHWLAARSRPILAWVAARGRPILARLAPYGRRVLGRVDRLQWLMPGVSRRAVLGLLLVAQLIWPAAFHAVTAEAAQPAKAPSVALAQAPAQPAAAQPAPGAPAPAPASPGAAPAPAAVPSPAQLMPEGMPIGQTTFIPTVEQMDNAKSIISTGQQKGLPPRAWVIAVATSLQETLLHNYGDLGVSNDHDSLGLFQQRPSSGWGTPSELTDPQYAASAFYNALEQVPGWQSLPLTVAAQDVQVSAFGYRYAQWETQATDMVLATYHIGPYWDVAP